jgi:hypothetical protein
VHACLELRVVASRNVDHLLAFSVVALGLGRRFISSALVVSVVVAKPRR